MSGWGRGQFKMFAKDIKQAYPGKAWSLIVDELREAVLCEKVLSVVLGQDRESVVIDDIQALYNGIKEEMGQLALWINDEHKDESMKVHAERKERKAKLGPRALHLLREIGEGRNRIFAFHANVPGFAELDRLGLAKREHPDANTALLTNEGHKRFMSEAAAGWPEENK
jgi:hypothetical protein